MIPRSRRISVLLLSLPLLVALSGCSQDSTNDRPRGTIDAAVVGEWRCVEKNLDDGPAALDIRSVLLVNDGYGNIEYTDSTGDSFLWATEDGTMNFIGCARWNHVSYEMIFEEGMIWDGENSEGKLHYRFSRIHS